MNILILGCGWVGEEFGRLMLRHGAQVTATTTTAEKKHTLSTLGIHVHLVNFDLEHVAEVPFTAQYDFVLNSVPASKRMSESEVRDRFLRVNNLLSNIDYQKHIYLSSIGIYPSVDGRFDETFANLEQLHPTLKVAEDTMSTLSKTIIFRLGGLFGKERILAKYFQNKVCNSGGQPANFVHLDDVVQLIHLGFKNNLQHNLYNVVAPEHPKKEEVIKQSAGKYGFGLPSGFDNTDNYQKIVSGDRLEKELDYSFKFPSPLDF